MIAAGANRLGIGECRHCHRREGYGRLLNDSRDPRSQASGLKPSEAQIRELIDGIVDGRVTRPQAAAFLAFVFNQGMTVDETVALTMAIGW